MNLMAQAILLHTKLCKMYRIYSLNYNLNESQVNKENTKFVGMQSIISRVSTNNQMCLNPLQIIEIHNTGHALPDKTYLID